MAKIAQAARLTASNDLLEALKRNSDAAAQRFEKSRHLTDRFLVVSFFESQSYGKLGIVSTTIVSLED